MTGVAVTVWPTVQLGTLLTDIQPGFASGKHNSTGDGVPHFRPMNVSTDGHIAREVLKYVEPTAGRPDLRLRRGDVVFNNTNSPELVGKTALFEDDDTPAFSNHMTRLRTDQKRLDPGYLALRLHQAWREGWFAEHCNNHVSQASIGRDVLRQFEIDLPPLNLQQAIYVLYQRVDASRASSSSHLATALHAIRRFRQAVLAAACSGRLTSNWRSFDSDAPSVDDLPARWERVELRTLAAEGIPVSYGIVKPGPEVVGGVPYVRQQDVIDGKVLIDQLAHTSPEIAGKHRRSELREGDVLLCIIRNLRVAIVPSGIDGANITQGMVRIRPSSAVLGEYLAIYLASPTAQRWMHDRYVGLAMPRINVEDARSIPVPLPPLDEQREIVQAASQLLTLAQAMAERIETASAHLDRSSQAVLAKAFSGELVGV